MGTMGKLALGIGSWVKFGKATCSIAAGSKSVAKVSTATDIASIANTQLNKVRIGTKFL